MLTLLAIAALAASPSDPLDAALQKGLWDMGVCVGMTAEVAHGTRLRVGWTLDDTGRTQAFSIRALDGSLPDGFAECAEARFRELSVSTAPGWTWTRTVEVDEGRFVPIALRVEEQDIPASDHCVSEARRRRPSVGGLVAAARPAGVEAPSIARDELGDPSLAACLLETRSPSSTTRADALLVLTVAPDVALPEDRRAHRPLSGGVSVGALVDRRVGGHGAVASSAQIRDRREALCAAGQASACGGWPLEIEALARQLGEACDTGEAPACTGAATAWMTLAPDQARARFGMGCAGGDPRACAELAVLDADRDALLSACEAGEGHGCLHLGLDLLSSAPHRARALWLHGLALGEDAVWQHLGHWWFHGLGGVADRERAERLWQRGCAAGDAAGCDALVSRVIADAWPGRSAIDILPWSQAACDAGHGPSCVRAGAVALDAADDLDASKEAYSRACDLGERDGCVAEAGLALLAPRPSGREIDASAHLGDACAIDDPTTWELCEAHARLRDGQVVGSVSPVALDALASEREALACARFGVMEVGVVIDAEGRPAVPPIVLSETNTGDARACVIDALGAVRWPRLRDGEVSMLRLTLEFEDNWLSWSTFGPPVSWPSGDLRWRVRDRSAGEDALPVILAALNHDTGLGACYDGLEVYSAELDLVVGKGGDAQRVKILHRTGSDTVDACMVQRLEHLRLPRWIDGRTRLRIGVLKP